MHEANSSKRPASSNPQTDRDTTALPRDERELDEEFERALRAAGIDPNAEPPADMDEFRDHLSRRISIFLATKEGYWRDCKEPGCRRMRACLAPNIDCSNEPPMPPDPDEKEWHEIKVEIFRALKERLAELGVEDD